jgi:glycosyltransferase involved in cell wall biosynthesis
MREICFVIHPYTARKDTGAGHDRYAYELIKGVHDLGVKHSIFESGHLKKIGETFIAEAKAIGRLLLDGGNKIYHATAAMNAQAPITTGKHPLVTTIHDVLWFHVQSQFDSKLKFKLKTRGIRRAAERSDKLVVPFRSTYDFLESELKIPASRMALIPYGVDHESFYPQQNSENLPRPEFFPQDAKIVYFVGSLTLGKGVDTLMNCFPQVLKAVPEARLVIGSGGWHKTMFHQMWQDNPAKDKIVMAGFIPEDMMRSCYIHADVTCFPSRYGFGLPTLESMACGTPTVSGRTLDGPEFVGDAGLMTDPNSADELAAQIISILTKSELSQRLKTAGLQKADQYRWSTMAKQCVDLYTSM